MNSYARDRKFTNYIHENLAIPLIYQPLQWKKILIQPDCLEEVDLVYGIDYVFQDPNGNIKTVQERFRDSKYQNYSDFTIRFKREKNKNSTRILSEYFKIKAHYFTYGITNGFKNNLSSCTDFLKYVILDLRNLYQKIDQGFILIEDNKESSSTIHDEKITCPIKYNRDGSSTFIPIQVKDLAQLWEKEIVIVQKGFL